MFNFQYSLGFASIFYDRKELKIEHWKLSIEHFY
jgi:hypothetical protein